VDGLEQLVFEDGLEQAGVHAERAKAVDGSRAVARGQLDHASAGELRPLAELRGQRQAVGIRHASIEQDERERPPRGKVRAIIGSIFFSARRENM